MKNCINIKIYFNWNYKRIEYSYYYHNMIQILKNSQF